jgi:hypothetical protein
MGGDILRGEVLTPPPGKTRAAILEIILLPAFGLSGAWAQTEQALAKANNMELNGVPREGKALKVPIK